MLGISHMYLNGTWRQKPCRINAGNQPYVPKRHPETKKLAEQMQEIIMLCRNA